MNLLKTFALAALAATGMTATAAYAADAAVKREMRSAWVATVWRLDWPGSVISVTGNANQIAAQKKQLTLILDSMAVNNMNAVNFQVRSRADAMYKSSYEPWSSDLVSQRGMDPGYDPLEFCVEECHKRGIECHAWINPYRYESQVGQWDGTPKAYRDEHPDWLLDVKGASILNPGKPEVLQRICDVAREIVTNYDVDGLLFDDYFYLSGTTDDQDADLYAAYKAQGGTLSQKDWRRDNVNRMVAAVYKTVKSVKPWIRFGVSPAGIACTSGAVAGKYGISACPTGSDWQYNDIYSDPVAWVSQQSLDFISPQIYWTIGNGTDYDKATKWWSGVANKWNRHLFVSHSISSLTLASKAPDGKLRASGPNAETFAEYANQIRLNRQYTLNDAPGSIFYSVKNMYSIAPKFAHYLKTQVFNTPALVPSMTWHPVSNPGNPSNVTKSAQTLSWEGPAGVRYTVYAVPASMPQANFAREAEYLLGTSYSTTYTIPNDRLSGYNYAVCTLDRYGNEYSPVFVGAASATLPAAQLTYPAASATVEMPFNFTWESVDKATSYIIEIAADKDMQQLVCTLPVQGTSVSTDAVWGLTIDKPNYWRVRACGNSFNDGVSEVRAFTPRHLEITSPAADATGVSLTPTVTWSFGERNVQVEIAADAEFANIVYSADATGGTHTVAPYALAAYTPYYVRARYERNGQTCYSPAVSFTTAEAEVGAPAGVTPTGGETLHADQPITVSPVAGACQLRLEVSASTAFSPRASFITTAVDTRTGVTEATGSKMKIGTASLSDGKTYYARARAAYNTASGQLNTEYSPVATFVYSNTAGVDNVTADNAKPLSWDGRTITVRHNGHAVVRVHTLDGRLVAEPVNRNVTGITVAAPALTPGVYVVTLNDKESIKISL